MTVDADRLVETAVLFGSLLLTLLVLFVPIAVGIALAQRCLGPERLQRWLGAERTSLAVGKGIALGAITPFCGCSTIPLLSGLLQARVRFSAVVAFLTASPLLSPYILAVVGVLFGARAAASYAVFGIAVSTATAVVWERGRLDRWLRGHVRPTRAPLPIAGGSGEVGADVLDSPTCGKDAAPAWRGLRLEGRHALDAAVGMLRPMLRPMLIGVAIGALIYGAVPERAVTAAVASVGPMAVPVAAVLGIPLYLRGEAAFPIGAGLLAAGVPTAPMLAMVVGGMAASLPEMAMLRGLFTWRLLAAYLATVFLTAVGAALVLPPLW